jgi:hypothetical protein
VNVVKELRKQRNHFSYRGLEEIKLLLRKALPVGVYSQIPWERWPQARGDRYNNFGLRFELVMMLESLSAAPELSAAEIAARSATSASGGV